MGGSGSAVTAALAGARRPAARLAPGGRPPPARVLRPASGRDLLGADPAHLPPPPAPVALRPGGERSIALAYAKALSRAQRLVYVEDQYLWSMDVARIFAAALRRAPRLQLVAVVPRYPDVEKRLYLEAARLGHGEALAMVREAGGDRVQVLDVENHQGRPVYVHAKLCVVDDVWALVGSANLNVRSWTHDSEVAVAVYDEDRDPRTPADPGGLGDGARRFARELRLQLMREHLDLPDLADAALLDPDEAAAEVREQRRDPGGLAPHRWARAAPTGPPAPPCHRPFRRNAVGLAPLAHRARLPRVPRPGRSSTRDETAAHLLSRAVFQPATEAAGVSLQMRARPVPSS